MRNQIVLVLAPWIGKTLTPEAAQAIVDQFAARGQPIDVAAIEPQICGSLVFRAERLIDIIPEMEVLHRAHWQETEAYRHGDDMDIDYEELVLEESAGTMIQFTARADGRLVGNFRLMLRRDRHTRRRFAHEDTWFLLPEYRHGRNALKFLDYPYPVLRAMGYQKFQAEAPDEGPAGRLLLHRGFKPVPKRTYILDEEVKNVLT